LTPVIITTVIITNEIDYSIAVKALKALISENYVTVLFT